MKNNKKNICFLLGSINGMGGTGRAVSILINELEATQKYNLNVICYYQKEKKQGYRLHSNVNVDIIFNEYKKMRSVVPQVTSYLVKYILKNKIHTIVACGSLYFPVAILASKFTKCKVICSDHSNYFSDNGIKFEREARNFAAKYSDILITLTEKDKENYRKNTKVKAKIDFIPNIVDKKLLTNKSTYKTDSKKIISVGRLTYAKNYELLIDIADEILRKYPDWSWDIYGSGELHDVLQEKINELNVARLTLKGAIANIYDVYQDYAFLVMTSRFEGYPMVLLEAIANKVPVIAFDCQTGPSDIIDHGKTGILIEENNAVQMLQGIEKLIVSDSLRSQMSEKCEGSIDRFSTNEIVNKWVKYLN